MDEHCDKPPLLTEFCQISLWPVKILLFSAVCPFPLVVMIGTSRMKRVLTLVLEHKTQHPWLQCRVNGFQPSHPTPSCSQRGSEHIFSPVYCAAGKVISIRRVGYNRWRHNLNHFVTVAEAHLLRVIWDRKRKLCMNTKWNRLAWGARGVQCTMFLLHELNCNGHTKYWVIFFTCWQNSETLQPSKLWEMCVSSDYCYWDRLKI